jgi:hypothetical protein
LEAKWEITGYTSIFFRYSFVATFFFKLSPSERSKSFGVSPRVFDTIYVVWSIVFPISSCGVARFGLDDSILSLFGFH